MLNKEENQVRSRLNKLASEMDARLVSRDRATRALVVSAIAKKNVLLLGDPGTGKSYQARLFAAGLGYNPAARGDYFELLLTKGTKDTEVLGAWKLEDIKKDAWNRKLEGKLPSARVAFLDEIFKCNSPILNAMLTISNERIVHQDSGAVACPTRIIIGASNEHADEDEGLGALDDRFPVRFWCTSVTDTVTGHKKLSKMRKLKRSGKLGPMPAVASVEDFDAAAKYAEGVEVSDETDGVLFQLYKEAKSKGIAVSDRTKDFVDDILRAFAWLEGSSEVSAKHFDFLRDVLWKTEDQRSLVSDVVAEFCKDPMVDARKINAAICSEFDQLPGDMLSVPESEKDAVGEQIVRVTKEANLAKTELRDMLLKVDSQGKAELEKALAFIEGKCEDVKRDYSLLKFGS